MHAVSGTFRKFDLLCSDSKPPFQTDLSSLWCHVTRTKALVAIVERRMIDINMNIVIVHSSGNQMLSCSVDLRN